MNMESLLVSNQSSVTWDRRGLNFYMYGRQLKELLDCYISFHMKKVFNPVFSHCQIVKSKAFADVWLQCLFVFLNK